MYKLGKILCDRCRTTLAVEFNFNRTEPDWETITTECKGSPGHSRRYDFCDIRCRVIHFRGRKYWQRKLQYIREAEEAHTEIDYLPVPNHRSRYFRDMREEKDAVIPFVILGVHEEDYVGTWIDEYSLDWKFLTRGTLNEFKFEEACRDLISDGLTEVAKPQPEDRPQEEQESA